MLKLCAPDQAFRDAYGKVWREAFDKARKKQPACVNGVTGLSWATDFLAHLHARLDELLTGEPHVLRQEIAAINADAQFGQFATYCAARPSKDSGLRDVRHEALLKIVRELFDYDSLSDKTTYGAYALVQRHDQRICPYCQLHHVQFYVRGKPTDPTFRPALDHFYPRSKYPYLGVSLFNLVPACEQCNSRIKLAKDPLATNLAHPFDDGRPLAFASAWRAVTALDTIGTTDDFTFAFDGMDADSKDFSSFFFLSRRYEWYGPELLDMAQRYRRFMDFDEDLRRAIDPKRYLLSFDPAEAGERALGVLLADVAGCMVDTFGVDQPEPDVSA